MDYEKKYNEAQMRADEAVQKGCLDKDMFDIIFPPEESEDERIRKGMIRFLESEQAEGIFTYEARQSWLAWLEKQKDKPVDAKLKRVLRAARRVLNNWLDGGDNPDVSGDFTELEHAIREYDGEEKQKEQKPIQFKNDELVEIIKGQFEGFRSLLKKKGIDYEPQRTYWEDHARLFDSSAREYVKEQKEQKPAEKQDYSGLNELERAIHRGFLCAGVENVPVTIIKETAKECLAQMKPAKWEDYKDKINIPYCSSEPEWSEEDEIMRSNLIEYFEGGWQDFVSGDAVKWLKSLRPQPKVEWNEEQKMVLDSLLKIKLTPSQKYFLTHLHPQPHWKPSEEQMGALQRAVNKLAKTEVADSVRLSIMYDNLKKLI